MDYGFIKVAAASPAVKLADCMTNAKTAVRCARLAAEAGAEIVVFPEMFLTGATCGDLIYNKALTDAAAEALDYFADETAELGIVGIIGLPAYSAGKIKSCAAVCNDGVVLGFEDRLYSCPDGSDLSLGIIVGSDRRGVGRLCESGANLVINLTSEAEIVGKARTLREELRVISRENLCGLVVSGAGRGESSTDYAFSGHSAVLECGEILEEKAPFSDDELIFGDIDLEAVISERSRVNRSAEVVRDNDALVRFESQNPMLSRKYPTLPFIPNDPSEYETILKIQSQALAQRIRACGAKKLIIGISGGLDSTLALIAAVNASELAGLERSSVVGITMPCFGTTKRTRGNAEKLCLELGVDFRCINITKAVTQHLCDIGHDGNPAGAAFENAQARERTQVLMDIANMENGLVVGTGDLSELALGWATYNGDHMSMYSVNADIPKTLIRRVVAYYADRSENKLSAVLYDILSTPVSPELLPAKDGEIAQKTEELLGAYEVHDFFIYYTLRYGYSPAKLYMLAKNAFAGIYSDSELLTWLETFSRRFITQQFKRSCSPDGPKVTAVDLSPRGGWKAPSDASAAVWLENIKKLK